MAQIGHVSYSGQLSIYPEWVIHFKNFFLKTVTNQFNHLLTIIIISRILLILEPFRIMLCEVLESVAVQNPPCLRRL